MVMTNEFMSKIKKEIEPWMYLIFVVSILLTTIFYFSNKKLVTENKRKDVIIQHQAKTIDSTVANFYELYKTFNDMIESNRKIQDKIQKALKGQ